MLNSLFPETICHSCGSTVERGQWFCKICGCGRGINDYLQFKQWEILGFCIVILTMVGICLICGNTIRNKIISRPHATILPSSTMTVPASNEPLPTPTQRRPYTPSVESTITQVYRCDDLNLVRLDIGKNAVIAWDAVNLRSTPEVPAEWDANRIYVLYYGDRVKIVGGPTCSHDGTWWQVKTENDKLGWIREYASPQGYLLEPDT